MTDVPGSGRLTPEQADWYWRKFGIRYTVVPDRPPTVPNREARRGHKKRGRRRLK